MCTVISPILLILYFFNITVIIIRLFQKLYKYIFNYKIILLHKLYKHIIDNPIVISGRFDNTAN